MKFLSPNSWLHHSSQDIGDGFLHAANEHIKALPAHLETPFRTNEFYQRVLADERTYDLTFGELLDSFKGVVKEKTGLFKPMELLKPIDGQENVYSLKTAQQRKLEAEAATMQAGKADLNKISVDELMAQHEKSMPIKPSSTIKAAKLEKIAPSNVAANALEVKARRPITTAEKVNAGMWGVGVIMAAFGALSAAHNTVVRDEDNKAHVVWSQVGVCMLQTAVAAGCGYMALQAFHGRSVG